MERDSPSMSPSESPSAAPRRIRLSKPEEGEPRGEVFALIRAIALVLGALAVVAWLIR